MVIRLLCLAGIALFLISCTVVEIIRRQDVDYRDSWISTYLTGPWSWLEDTGFYAMSVSLLLLPHVLNLGLVQTVAATVGAVALLLVVWTRKYFGIWFKLPSPTITRYHVISAGIAFAGTAIAAWAHFESVPAHALLILTAIISVGIINAELPDGEQIAEKIAALGISLAALSSLV